MCLICTISLTCVLAYFGIEFGVMQMLSNVIRKIKNAAAKFGFTWPVNLMTKVRCLCPTPHADIPYQDN